MSGFDVVVVGAGTAGCVVAARLSEDPALRVALVEAGTAETDPDIADPARWPFLAGRSYDWGYVTVPQAGTAGRVHPWPRGRLLGGSSCLNAMGHVRGHPDDFAAWAEVAGARWSYAGLLPGFRRSERFTGNGVMAAHGQDGPLAVRLPDAEVSPLVRAYMAAGEELGAPRLGDHNSGPMTGTAANQLTVADGRRVSAADAYLTPALGRPNLTVLTGVAVERLVVDGNRATRLLVRRDGRAEAIDGAAIVLCAGAVATPLLLMRSGIGDPAGLAAADVAVRLPLPGVGGNLHDHLLGQGNLYRARRPVPPSRLQHSESLMYLHADDPARADGSPDMVLACVVLPVVSEQFTAPPAGEAYTLLFGVTHPTSRGRLALTGPSLADPPLIDPAYLQTEHDRRQFRAALRVARAVGQARPLDAWRDAELLPGPDVTDDGALDAFIARAAGTHHHPVGTCRMGGDADAVVDGDLRLHGLDNVHVVDASVIPRITAGPVNAAVTAIAETWCREVFRPS
ncbi:MAG: GMC family oxidoreductase N-terminal domain-containing protein [Geminicoccaceae bacterium]